MDGGELRDSIAVLTAVVCRSGTDLALGFLVLGVIFD